MKKFLRKNSRLVALVMFGIFLAVVVIVAAVSVSQSNLATEIPAKPITLPATTDAATEITQLQTDFSKEKITEISIPSSETAEDTTPCEFDYILNKNTKKFHLPTCASAKKIKDINREEYKGTKDDLISKGYFPCGNCKP